MATFDTWASAWGPTDDGRIKPDVVANGVELYSPVAFVPDSNPPQPSNSSYDDKWGTSMAAPNTTGTAVQLIEHFNNEYQLTPGSAVKSATMKGILIHTAYDVTDSPGTTGPDYAFGWGVVDGAAAATFITNAATPGLTHSLFEATYAGSGWSQQVQSAGSDPLKVTIVWTDPEGTAHDPDQVDDTTPVLVNDLDVWITDSGGTYYHPWILDPCHPDEAAVRHTDTELDSEYQNHLDNVEQVLIDSGSSGVYTIHLGHTGTISGGSQGFSMMISGAAVIPDIQITGFRADGYDMLVDYTINVPAAGLPEFDIGIYRSANGSTLDAQLMYKAVTNSADRTAGEHTVPVDANFSDPYQDYYLAAKVDSALEIAETNENNNVDFFAGGAFYDATRDTVHVHGTDAVNDAVHVALSGANVEVTLNGGDPFSYPSADVSQVHIRAHDGSDDLTVGSGMNKVLWAFGGDGNDWLRGGGGDDYLVAGAGNDTIYAGGGDDYLFGGSGNDTLYGYGGADVLSGDDGDDELYGGEGGDFLQSGYGVDDLWGEDGDDYLTVYDGEGGDTAYGGYGYDYAYGDYGDVMDAEEEYYEGGERGGGADAGDGYPLEAEELIYAALQDQRSLQLWRELLWFYLEWDKKRRAS